MCTVTVTALWTGHQAMHAVIVTYNVAVFEGMCKGKGKISKSKRGWGVVHLEGSASVDKVSIATHSQIQWSVPEIQHSGHGGRNGGN